MTTKNKKTASNPIKGQYRTLVVGVDTPAQTPEPVKTPILEDVRVPETLKAQMAALDLSALDPDVEDHQVASAVPESEGQQALVDYFEVGGECTETLMATYLRETRGAEPNDALFLRYHRQGNLHLERLIIACIERNPSDKGLLYDLAHLSRFGGDAAAAVDGYSRALITETQWPALRALADDICDHGSLMTQTSRAQFQDRLRDHPEKWQLLENTMERHGGSDE